MKERNNIDQFFKKRLAESTSSEGDWNIPDDKIWDSAKAHFPKKKKRRLFPFFILGLGVLAILFFTIGEDYQHISLSDQTSVVNDKTQPLPITKEINQETKEATTNLEITVPTQLSTKNNITSNTKTNYKTKEGNKIRNKSSKQINPKVGKQSSDREDTRISKSKSSDTPLYQHKESPTNETTIDIRQAGLSIPTSELDSPSETPSPNDHRDRLNRKATTPIASIVLRPIESMTTIKDVPHTPAMKVLHTPKKNYIPNWEIGISHAPFIVNPFKITEIDLETGESLNLNSTYRNINLNLTKKISPRFSISSGVLYSTLDVQMDFSFADNYKSPDSIGNFKSQVDETTSFGSLSVNEESNEFEINFIPGSDVNHGDLLRVNGMIPIDIFAIQIPMIANYHFRRGKLDWLLHGGLTIDVISSEISSLDLTFYKGPERVTEPIVMQQIKNIDFGLSVYVGGGLKYYIGKHWNLGASTKFDVTGIIFSRFDFGLYYGF